MATRVSECIPAVVFPPRLISRCSLPFVGTFCKCEPCSFSAMMAAASLEGPSFICVIFVQASSVAQELVHNANIRSTAMDGPILQLCEQV